MTKKSPGRPLVYTGEVKVYIVSLLREIRNITYVRRILNAEKPPRGTKCEWYAQRDKKIVPVALGISVPTLRRYAGAKRITFDRGRPVTVAA